MDTLDLLEDLLADYEGTLILVSHDRDFIDRLATSTVALDGRGNAVETPGGWSDFQSQNPGFFEAAPTTASAPKPQPAPTAARKPTKLSYKDARRLDELTALIDEAPARIAGLEDQLHDPDLYSRDPAKFDRLTQDLEKLRADLVSAEEEWLILEEKRETLGG